MTDSAALPLHEWETFYVIIGSSAAALTGLMFVVVALSAEWRARRGMSSTESLDTFGTPTVVHFCAVLLLAALVTTPRETPATLGGCVAALGAAGLLYGARVLVRARRQRDYDPVLSDWVWHTVLPFVGYSALLSSGLAMRRDAVRALYGVGAAELLLLFIGIHNAWDAAVWITATLPPPAEPPARDAGAPAAPARADEPPAGRS